MTLYYRYGPPVSVDEALTVPCPMCGKGPGEFCVYIWPKGLNPDPDLFRWRSRATQNKIKLVGEPTSHPHNDRRALFSLDRDRGYRLLRLRQLRDWLREHGDIFEERKR